ncbi:MAG: tetratricopeptide repeat protein [Rhodoferax sp.]|uniref:tetratricopeptide repeat protein n=1 Tax=Rhodoferax sp. TaxID=50421 RepID=UPI001B4B5AE3|nr:tetratricopeptide repeat protein [Rhodoferax sp.]MBP9904081.1 tetratricopeptide repeat protein [Rhodoferax sp.]
MRFNSLFLRAITPLALGCMLSLSVHSADAPQRSAKVSAMDSGLFYQLLLGELNARNHESATAFSLLLDAARKTGDPNVFRRAVQIAIQARAGESALQAAKAWRDAEPTSSEANLFVLQILLGLNRVADTVEPIQHEITLTPAAEQREFLWRLPHFFDRVSDRQLAAATVQNALQKLTDDPSLGATAGAVIGRMWLGAGDKTAALAAASKALSLNPNAEHPALLAMSMLGSDTPQAEQLVRQHLPQARAEFRIAFIKALLGQQREVEARAELAHLQSSQADFAEAWLIHGALDLQQQQLDPAQRQLQRYLDLVEALPQAERSAEVRRGRSQALMSLAQVAQLRKDLVQADALLQRVDNPDDVLRAQVQRANLLAQQGKTEDALTLIQNQTEHSEADVRLKRMAEVALLREHKLFDRARDRLKAAITQNPHDTDLMYDLAMVSEKLGEMEEMERLLRSLIAAKPEDPHAYNALGYSLADRNMRLPEARDLIAKALALAPGDPFITDSLAWAEFRSGNHARALELLQAAFKDKPDAEIAAHLGEVLWVSQRQAEALHVFREAVKLNRDNETLQETLKRLRVPL